MPGCLTVIYSNLSDTVGTDQKVPNMAQLTSSYMRTILEWFARDEDGAMTVEWVAIAAAVVVGAVALTWSVLEGLGPVAGAIGTTLTDAVGTIENPE